MTSHECEQHHMKYIEGGHVCAICGNFYAAAEVIPMERPSMTAFKRPVDRGTAIAEIVENMDRIKEMRKRHISYRAIAERLNLSMNHTTLQKHYTRITAGLPELKRGRKASVREVAA